MDVDLAELGLEVRSDGTVVASKRLRDLTNESKKAETATEKLIRRTEKLSQTMGKVGRSMTLRLTAPILAMSGAAVKFAGDFESSFANIRKTVNATEPEFARMEMQIRQLAKTVPTSVEQLNELGGVAGQLGIQSKNIVTFTKTIAMLGDTTDIAGEQAALSLSRFMNIMGTAQSDIDRVGSTIVGLGNNFAAMESEIVDTATSLAAFGSQMGLTEAQVLAYAAAIAASGGETQAASSAFQKTAIVMQRAVLETNKDLAVFAEITGRSIGEFSQAFREDASGAMLLFLQGLKDISDQGLSTAAALEKVGLTDIRLQREFGKLLGNLDQLDQALGLANVEWKKNTALTEEALKRYETFNSRMKIFWNDVKDLGITIGNDLIPIIDDLSESVRGLVKAMQDADPETRRLIIQVGLLTAALGPLLIVLAAITKSISILTPLIVTMAGLFTTIGAAAGVAAVALEREFVPGMDEVGKTEQVLNVLTRAWVILRETALGVGEAVLGIGIAIAGGLRGIVSPLEAAIRSLHTALNELIHGNFKAGLAALAPTAIWDEMQTAMAKAQKMIEKGLGFSIEANNKRIEEAVDNVNDLRNGLLKMGKSAEEAADGIDETSDATEKMLALIKSISTIELPKVELLKPDFLPKILDDNEKLIESLKQEKDALEAGGEAWEAYEKAMFQAAAVSELGEKFTAAQAEAVRELAGAIFDLRKQADSLDLERAFSRFFVELSSNGDKAFKNLIESFRLSFIEEGADELLDMIESFGDDFLGEFKDIGPEISTVLKAALIAGADGSKEAIGAAIGSAIGAAVGGEAGAKIGALLGSVATGLFGGGTPSGNAGLLLGQRRNFSGIGNDRLFGSFDLFGQEAQLFARREDQDAAIAASRQFIQLQDTIGTALESIGLELDKFSINLRGLDENGKGIGAFLGQAAEDGEAVGQSVAMQLLSVARQAIEQIAKQSDGLIPPDVLHDILFPHGAATVVSDVTSAFQEFFNALSDGEKENLRIAQEANAEIVRLEQERQTHLENTFENVLDKTANFLNSITDPITGLMRTIRNDISAITNDFSTSMDSIIDAQIRHLDSLRQAALSNHAEELRREEELHNTRLRLADSLHQFVNTLRTGSLSALPNRERFELAQSLFRSTLSATLSGDVDAADKLQGAAQTYAELSRMMFASTDAYTDSANEILAGLDAAAELLGASEFNPQAANDRLVAELQRINEQLSMLPAGISSSLAPLFNQILVSGLAAGQSIQQIATRTEGVLATSNVLGADTPASPFAEYAYTKQDAKDAVAGIVDTSNSLSEIISKSATVLKNMGFTSAYLQELFPGTDIFGLLDTYGISHFEHGGAVTETGPALVHRNEHVINADRDNLVVNVQSNTEGITELRDILKDIRDDEKRYQNENMKELKSMNRTLTAQVEATRKVS